MKDLIVLLEKFLPVFQFNEKHSILISAPPSTVSARIEALEVSESWIIRTLLALRGIPRKTSSGIESWKKMGFVVLDHQPDQEIILGLIGQFWKPTGKIQSSTAEEFTSFNHPDFAKAVWNLKSFSRRKIKFCWKLRPESFAPQITCARNLHGTGYLSDLLVD